MTTKNYTLGEEIANAITHGIGALLGVAALIILVWHALTGGTVWHLVSGIIYGSSLILLYMASTLYHAITNMRAKRILQLMDHAAIFILIAGTYTPFLLVNLRGPWGWSLFTVIWTIAIAGVFLETMKKERIKWLSLTLYLGLGWMAVIAIKPMLELVNSTALWLLLAGGLSYTLGVVFYVWKSMRYHHAIWHLFVLSGSVFHLFSILEGVMR